MSWGKIILILIIGQLIYIKCKQYEYRIDQLECDISYLEP